VPSSISEQTTARQELPLRVNACEMPLGELNTNLTSICTAVVNCTFLSGHRLRQEPLGAPDFYPDRRSRAMKNRGRNGKWVICRWLTCMTCSTGHCVEGTAEIPAGCVSTCCNTLSASLCIRLCSRSYHSHCSCFLVRTARDCIVGVCNS
jgi:hypothetical protein